MYNFNSNIGEISGYFASYIKFLREERGMSLAEVEEKSGISASYISRIENEERKNLTLSILCRLAKIYDKPIETIIKVALCNDAETEELEDITDILMGLKFKFADKEADEFIKLQLVTILKQMQLNKWGREEEKTLLEKIDALREYLVPQLIQ